MNFLITFTVNFGKLSSYTNELKGITELDMIREELEVSNLSPESISLESNEALGESYVIQVSEELARKSKLFQNDCRARVVIIHGNFFDKFYKRHYRISNLPSGEIHKVKVDRKLDKELLLKQWEIAGFPEVWG